MSDNEALRSLLACLKVGSGNLIGLLSRRLYLSDDSKLSEIERVWVEELHTYLEKYLEEDDGKQ